MRYKIWVRYGLGTILLACPFCMVGMAVATQGAQEKEKVRVIPRSAIYTVGGAKGMKQLNHGAERLPDGTLRFKEPYGADLDALMRLQKSWASNIFLVRGEEVADAINAARLVVLDGGRYA